MALDCATCGIFGALRVRPLQLPYGCVQIGLPFGPYLMYQVDPGISCGVCHCPAVLAGMDQSKLLCIKLHSICQRLLAQLAEAVEEDNWAEGLGLCVVIFSWFGNDYHDLTSPCALSMAHEEWGDLLARKVPSACYQDSKPFPPLIVAYPFWDPLQAPLLTGSEGVG